MDALSDFEKLSAIEEITSIKALRDLAVDTKDWNGYLALHAPDHVSYNDDYPPWTSAEQMIVNLRKIMDHLTTNHHSHTPLITFEGPTRASGIWAMKGVSSWRQGEQDHWFIGFGHYYETYEKRDGKWLFTSRRLRYLHTRKSPGAIFPPPGVTANENT